MYEDLNSCMTFSNLYDKIRQLKIVYTINSMKNWKPWRKNMDMQIATNYLYVFILPLLFGGILRFACRKFSKAWLITVATAILSLVAWIITLNPPIIGSELYAIRTMQSVCIMIGSLLVGLLLIVYSVRNYLSI
jgi:hypothetical protein